MLAVLSSFVVVGIIILLGYLLQRGNVLGDRAHIVLTRLVFYVASPTLLFETVSKAEPHDVFGYPLAVQVLSVLMVVAVYVLVSRLLWKQNLPDTVVGSMSSSYVNVGNLGIPLAAYVLGDTTQIAPILLFQLAVYTPVVMFLFEVGSGKGDGFLASVRTLLKNPVLIASLLGVVFMAADWSVPHIIDEPLTLLAGMSVPCMLITFGMSFAGMGRTSEQGRLPRIAVVVALKNVIQPILAYALAALVFDLDQTTVFACVVMAALPSAQNVYNYAVRFGAGSLQARDAGFITTVVSVPVLILVAALLSH